MPTCAPVRVTMEVTMIHKFGTNKSLQIVFILSSNRIVARNLVATLFIQKLVPATKFTDNLMVTWW